MSDKGITLRLFLLAAFWGVLLVPGVFAGGTQEAPPQIQMNDQPRQFIAPGNADATVKRLSLPFQTLTFTAKGQVIKSWIFSVFDTNGVLVSQDSRLETRDRGFFAELFNIGDRPQVEIPKDLTWDGAYHLPGSPKNGQLVPDGNYTYQISIVDSAGGRAQTPPFAVTVRNSPITIDYLRTVDTIFSPTGQRSSVRIEQTGSREAHWEGVFKDSSGHPVRTVVWDNPTLNQIEDRSPPTFDWDGKNDAGEILADGGYSYTLEGRSRSGAVLAKTLDAPLVIRSTSGLAKLSTDQNFFAPEGNGTSAVLTLLPQASDAAGLTSWELWVADSLHAGQKAWSTSGKQALPDHVVFDGKDNAGLPLPQGHYDAVLQVVYDNGNVADSDALPFDLYRNPPSVTLTADHSVFGGAGRAGVAVTLHGEKGVDWKASVLGPDAQVVKEYALGKEGESTFEFQGLDVAGKSLADGSYLVKATGQNEAGIAGEAQLSLRKDSRSPNASLDLSTTTLVPGNDKLGVVRVTPNLLYLDSVEKTVLSVVDSRGTSVAAVSHDGVLPYWDWDAKASGTPVPDGTYQVRLEATYLNGFVAKAQTPLRVDSKALVGQGPRVEMTLSSKTFVPGNVDGASELKIGIQASAGEDPLASWDLTVYDPRGLPFRTWKGQGLPPSQIVWDGKSDKGEDVASGDDYRVSLKVNDAKGRTTSRDDTVTIDILVKEIGPGRYKIVISSIQFAGYSSDVLNVRQDLLEKNLFVLRRLATVLNKFPDYKIGLEGYAVSVYWNDPKTAAKEQRDELIPLSTARAEEVRNALRLLGVDGSRFTVQGFGSERPIVPNSDLENRWRNRRVEFYLNKNP